MIKKIKIYILTFLLIYNPPIYAISTIHYLALYSWTRILYNKETSNSLLNDYKYKSDIMFLLFYIFYFLFVGLINSIYSLSLIYNFFVIIMEVIPTCFIIVKEINNNKKVIFNDLIIKVGLIQALIAFITLFFPNIHNAIINIYLKYGYKDTIIYLSQFRMYGYSYILPFTMPITQSMIAIISFDKGINKKYIYILYSLIIFLSAIINARISIIIYLIGLMFIIFNVRHINIINIFKIIPIIISIIIIINKIILFIPSKTIIWIEQAWNDILYLINNRNLDSESFKYFSSNNAYRIPQNILNLFFGTATLSIRNNISVQSDVGFINDIWIGGIFYIFITYIYIMNKIKFTIEVFSKKNMQIYLIIIIFLIANLKGQVISYNEFINLMILISVYYKIKNK